MKTITFAQEVKVYEFKDLSKEVQEKVIYDHAGFMIETEEYDKEYKGNFERAIDKAEKMQTPWFTVEYVKEYCRDEIIETIEINNYLFNEKGDMLPVTYYMKDNKVDKTTYEISAGNEVDVIIK